MIRTILSLFGITFTVESQSLFEDGYTYQKRRHHCGWKGNSYYKVDGKWAKRVVCPQCWEKLVSTQESLKRGRMTDAELCEADSRALHAPVPVPKVADLSKESKLDGIVVAALIYFLMGMFFSLIGLCFPWVYLTFGVFLLLISVILALVAVLMVSQPLL